MADYQLLKEAVAAVIKQNGNQEITGDLLQSTLLTMINSLGSGYQFAGVADGAVVPGTPDAKLFYIAAGPGVYTNFGGLTVNNGELAIFFIPEGSGSWYKQSAQIGIDGKYFGGIVGTASVPTLSQNIFYLAGEIGTYSNFNLLKVALGELAIFTYTGSQWVKQTVASVNSTRFIIDTALHKSISASGLSANQWFLFPYFEGASKFRIVNEGSGIIRFWLRYDNSSSVQEYVDVPGNSQIAITPGSQYNGLFFYYTQYANAGTFRIYPISPEQEATESAIAQNTSDISSAENDIAKIKEETADLYVDVPYNVTTSPDYTVASSYITSNGGISSSSPFSLVCYNVQAGDKFKLSTRGGAGSARRWALYNTNNIASIGTGTVTAVSSQTIAADTDITIVCEGGGILAIQNYTAFTTFLIYKLISERDYITRTDLKNIGFPRYEIGQDFILVSQPYDADYDIVFRLAKGGGNNLFDFKRIYLIDKGASLSEEKTLLHGIGSDWIGPYQVGATTNINGDDIDPDTQEYNVTFTGGNHQYNNQGSGSTPTARCAFLKFFIDGVEKTSGNGIAKQIRMVWENYIQGYNTKLEAGGGREILKEDIELVFDGTTFNISHSFTPLEEVLMKIYYGVQCTGFGGLSPLFTQYLFKGSVDARQIYAGNQDANCKKADSLVALGSALELEVFVDKSFDLGQRMYVDANSGYFFKAASGSKCYSRLVYITPGPVLPQNNTYRFKGGWIFHKPINNE